MSHQIRTVAALLAASAILLGSAAPAAAAINEGLRAAERSMPVLLDMLVMRPLGLLLTTMGTVFFVATSPLVLITRPTDIAKPFKVLVARPFTYTFVDALGEH